MAATENPMRNSLALYGALVFAALVAVSTWATLQLGVMDAIRELIAHPRTYTQPWFIATVFDAYFAFLWFWLWVAYREKTWLSRIAWLVLIFSLGNMAMAGYVLLALRRLPKDAPVEALLLRQP
jgi:hypothetical protein